MGGGGSEEVVFEEVGEVGEVGEEVAEEEEKEEVGWWKVFLKMTTMRTRKMRKGGAVGRVRVPWRRRKRRRRRS
jgi:hypothetical protein